MSLWALGKNFTAVFVASLTTLNFRFELDMLLESVTSTAKRAEELLNSINVANVENPIRIEDHFTGLFLSADHEARIFPKIGLCYLRLAVCSPADLAFPTFCLCSSKFKVHRTFIW